MSPYFWTTQPHKFPLAKGGLRGIFFYELIKLKTTFQLWRSPYNTMYSRDDGGENNFVNLLKKYMFNCQLILGRYDKIPPWKRGIKGDIFCGRFEIL